MVNQMTGIEPDIQTCVASAIRSFSMENPIGMTAGTRCGHRWKATALSSWADPSIFTSRKDVVAEKGFAAGRVGRRLFDAGGGHHA